MTNLLNRNCGFTLAEILVVLFIFSLVIGAMFTVLISGNTSWQIAEVRIELQQELRKSLGWLDSELRQSNYLKIGDAAADGDWYNRISFALPSGVVSGNIVWQSERVQYLLGGLNNKQLLRIKGTTQRIVANHLTSFQVRRFPSTPNIVEIALAAEKPTAQGKIITANLNFKLRLRN